MGALLSQFMNKYSYTDFHELNADWLIKTLMEMINQVENFVSLNAIKYADPIQWNIVTPYEKNTVVIDPLTGTAYISVQPVPSGVALTRTEYWTVVFDLGSFVVRAAKNFSNRYEAETTLTATFPTTVGKWLVWGDTLYEALVNITAGDKYVIDSNIKHITMEEVADALAQAIQTAQNDIDALDTKVGNLSDLTTSVTTSVVLAINSVLNDLNTKIGDLSNLTTTDKSDIVGAINEVNGTGGGAIAMIGNLDNLTTTAKDNVVNAINEVDSDIAQEVTDRDNADGNLQNQINQLTGGTWEHYTQADSFTNANATDFPTFVGDCYVNKDLGLMNISFIANTNVAQGKSLNGNTLVANLPFKMKPNQTIGVYEACMMNMYRVSDGLIYFAHTGALFKSDANGNTQLWVILEDFGQAGINTISLMGQITIPIADWGIVGTGVVGTWEHYTQKTGIANADPISFPTMVADCYINRKLGLMSLSFICNTNETLGRALNGNQNLFTLPFTMKSGSYGYYEACILDMYNTVTKRNYWAHTGMIINVNSLGQPTVQAILESFGTNGLNTCAVVGNITIPISEIM